MKSIGFPPGANKFRFLVIVIIVGMLWVLFFDYADRIAIETEKASVQQTKNIINSALVVIFSEYAVKGELDRLNELNGANPFTYLALYNLVPGTYQGELRGGDTSEIAAGWYYDGSSGKVIYKPFHGDGIRHFALTLEYRDLNGSGIYEPGADEYQRLVLGELSRQR